MRRVQTKVERTRHRLKRSRQRSKRREADQMDRFKESARKLVTIKADGTVITTVDGKRID